MTIIDAHLFAGQDNSGKVVTPVKQQAWLRALDTDAALRPVEASAAALALQTVWKSAGRELFFFAALNRLGSSTTA